MTSTIPERTPLGASTLNRDWYLDVNTGTAELPTWIGVFGITNFQPVLTPQLQDDSDYDSEGYQSQTATAIAWSLSLTVSRKLTRDVAPTYDPGQEFLRTASEQMGEDNSVQVRWYKNDAAQTEAYDGYAAVSWSPNGGDMAALDTVGVTLTGQGKRNSITFPV